MPILKKIKLDGFYALLCACGILLLSAQLPPSREYQVKAVFLFNFSQFVEWPDKAFSSDKAPLVIGVLGDDPFGHYLDDIVSGEKVNGHPLIIQRYHNIQEASTCHILFINKGEMDKTDITNLKGNNVLTVSDDPSFIQKGGMIRFFTSNNKIQFQINPEVAKAGGLTISSKLLRLAEIVPNK